MKGLSCSFLLCVLAVILTSNFALADKPSGDDGFNGNGFPSGPHFNLNLIGKKDNFTCPEPEFDLISAEQVFGHVIFIPREQGSDPITILMESGKKGPKGKPDAEALEVTDWCTESFPDYGTGNDDGAMLRLPKNDNGYRVYARVTGKPGTSEDDHTLDIFPGLVYVEDENANNLIDLGLVFPDGSGFTSTGETLKRTDDGKKGKGVRKASDITALFEWSGDVCYVQEDTDQFCLDEFGIDICTSLSLCCIDEEEPFGAYERCDLLTVVGEIDGEGDLVCPAMDELGDDYIMVDAQCRHYDNEWVFNIGDFVGYLWDLDSTGSYVVQVRFYPQ